MNHELKIAVINAVVFVELCGCLVVILLEIKFVISSIFRITYCG
jgi:hypothetical protein